MDWSSVIGLALALAGLVVGQALEGGKMASLLQPAAFAIVIVGTFGAVLLQTRLRTFVRGLEMLRWVFLPPPDTRAALARDIGPRPSMRVAVSCDSKSDSEPRTSLSPTSDSTGK